MNESLQNIGDLIAEPSAAFSRLKLHPRSGIAFCVFFLISVLLGWAILPYTEALISQQFSSSTLAPEQREAAENISNIMKNVGIFLGPLLAILWFIGGSALLKLASRFFIEGDTLRFRHIYAAVVHISLIGCLIQLMNTALLFVFRDVGDIKTVVDFKMIPGLHLLFGNGGNPKLMMFLSHINPLSLWLIGVMAIAVAVFADMEKTKARVIAIVLWIISVLPEVVFAT